MDQKVSQSVDSQTGGYTPTPEEQAVLLAIPRDFLKFGALGFAGGSIATHIGLKMLMGDSVKKSFAVRYGGPVGVGLLVGVVWGMNKVTSHLEHLVYDLPSSPLTAIYRKKFVRVFADSVVPKEVPPTESK